MANTQLKKDNKGIQNKARHLSLFDVSKEVSYSTSKPNIVSFFSGCGGLDLGFEKAGYNIAISQSNKLIYNG